MRDHAQGTSRKQALTTLKANSVLLLVPNKPLIIIFNYAPESTSLELTISRSP
jgi:hypothetical protein